MLFADIIIDISVKSLDRPFQYRVPDPLQADAVIGALVDIPFGKGNRTVFPIPQKETVQGIYQILCTDLPDHYFAEFYCKRFGNYQYVKKIF